MVGPPADLGPWADGPNGASTATPNSTPNSTLVMSASQPSSTWEGVEEDSSQFPYGRDTTAVLRRVAPVEPGDGNSEGSLPSNPVHRNSLNYRTQVGGQTDAGANAPVPNNRPAGVGEEGAREAPQGTRDPERSLPAPSGAELSSSSPAAESQAPADPQVTNPHAGAQPSSSSTSAPASSLPRLPYPWRQYWCDKHKCLHYHHPGTQETTWIRPGSEVPRPPSSPDRPRQVAPAARAAEPAVSSSNMVSPTITRTIRELRQTKIPFGNWEG